MGRRSDQQLQVNLQLSENMTEVKTQLLFLSQALGAATELIDGLTKRLVQRDLLDHDDPLLLRYRRAIQAIRSQGLRLEAPADPDAPQSQVRCPGCDAIIKSRPGQRVERCDWCGHVFAD